MTHLYIQYILLAANAIFALARLYDRCPFSRRHRA